MFTSTTPAPIVALLRACLASLLLFCSSAIAQNPETARSGEFFLVNSSGQTRPALLVRTDVTMDISGMTNRVRLRQSFTNDSSDWQEGIYVFPLPEDSAVNAMKMMLGERELIGDIRERAEAKQIYEIARSEGKKAALVEQQRPNLFTQKVANLAPGETISVELQYIQALRYDAGRFSVRFPMTLTPRYIPGLPLGALDASGSYASSGRGWAAATDSVPDARDITPPYTSSTAGNPITMTIRLDAGLALASVGSTTHELVSTDLAGGPGRVELRLKNSSTRMDRDFELEWIPAAGSAPQAAAFVDSREEGTFMQVLLLPPRIEEPVTQLAREVVIVLDSSGSMDGTSMVQAKQAVELALLRLRVDDYFNIIDFDSVFSTVFPASVPATPDNLALARRFVQSLQADGGTEMYPALQFALTQPVATVAGKALLQQIVFITDGSVGNEQQLFALINAELDDARLFTIGIGSAPNSYFMRKAAETGRGTYTFINDMTRITQDMDALLRKLENAVMVDLHIEWPAGVNAEYYPVDIPDLYLGEPLFVTARLQGLVPAQQTIMISGTVAGRSWQRQLSVTTASTANNSASAPLSDSSLASYWARQKITALLDTAMTPARNEPQFKEQLRQQVLDVALPFKLLSPYTSFVAVEQKISRPVAARLASNAIGNEPPAGQTLAAQMAAQQQALQLVYPATATPAVWLFCCGLAALLLALLLLWARSWGARAHA